MVKTQHFWYIGHWANQALFTIGSIGFCWNPKLVTSPWYFPIPHPLHPEVRGTCWHRGTTCGRKVEERSIDGIDGIAAMGRWGSGLISTSFRDDHWRSTFGYIRWIFPRTVRFYPLNPLEKRVDENDWRPPFFSVMHQLIYDNIFISYHIISYHIKSYHMKYTMPINAFFCRSGCLLHLFPWWRRSRPIQVAQPVRRTFGNLLMTLEPLRVGHLAAVAGGWWFWASC